MQRFNKLVIKQDVELISKLLNSCKKILSFNETLIVFDIKYQYIKIKTWVLENVIFIKM